MRVNDRTQIPPRYGQRSCYSSSLHLPFHVELTLLHHSRIPQQQHQESRRSHLLGSARRFSGHSLRRGGATFAFQCGIPSELIKLQGDWRSDAYMLYLSLPLADRLVLSNIVSDHVSCSLAPLTTPLLLLPPPVWASLSLSGGGPSSSSLARNKDAQTDLCLFLSPLRGRGAAGDN